MQEYFASADEYPPINDPHKLGFRTRAAAIEWYDKTEPYSEYGLTELTNKITKDQGAKMCGCASEHVGIECGSEGCHCHTDGSGNPTTLVSDKNVYMNISFSDIKPDLAQHILDTVTKAVGLVSYSVFIDDSPEEDDNG
jgi:hypothetical protein